MNEPRSITRTATLAADETVANLPAVALQIGGHLDIHVSIDNGAGIAPTDTPVGVWELWCSSNGVDFYLYNPAAVISELALIAPNGNNLVDAWAVFANVPGTAVKVRYNASSGGATSARAILQITT